MENRLSYDREHDACGIGAVIRIDGVPEYSCRFRIRSS